MGEVRSLELRYTKRALQELFAVLSYIEDHSPQGAINVQRRIQQSIALLKEQPHLGATTPRPAYRRIILSPYPYVVLYRATKDAIIIHAVRHAARKPRGW